MLLDALKDFNWYNEPLNVRFNEQGMIVEVKSGTDFWQNSAHRVSKDDGHFFYSSQAGDFDLSVKWHASSPIAFAQSGLMLRQDSQNWAKFSFLSQGVDNPQIGSVVAMEGFCDWAVTGLPKYQDVLWYRARRRAGDISFSYSLDGETFTQIRLFRFITNPLVLKVGAYACSPQRGDFRCVLESLDLIEVLPKEAQR